MADRLAQIELNFASTDANTLQLFKLPLSSVAAALEDDRIGMSFRRWTNHRSSSSFCTSQRLSNFQRVVNISTATNTSAHSMLVPLCTTTDGLDPQPCNI